MLPESQSPSQALRQGQGHSLLLALPSELIRLICTQFCRHCCKVTPLEVITGQDEISPLKPLSETCFAFRDLAQPLLHHVPRIQCYSLFLRTIRECPDLAESVKCFQGVSLLEFGHESVSQHITKDGFAMIKEVAAALQMITPRDEPLEDEMPYLVRYIDGMAPILSISDEDESEFADRQAMGLEMLLLAISIALLPSLEMLCLSRWGCFEPLYKHARRRLDRVGRLAGDRCGDISMPFLHTLIVPGWSDMSQLAEEEEQVYVHLDPRELFFDYMPLVKQLVFNDLNAPFDWPAVSKVTGQTMWSALPDLRSVVFDEMVWGAVMQPDDNVLTDKEHDTAYQRIRQMAEQCPKLSSFKLAIKQYPSYEFEQLASINPFSPSRLLQSLLPADSRLETLMIHMESVPQLQSNPARLVGVDLHRFTQLQQISLDEFCFCQHWMYKEKGKEEAGGECPEICRNNSCLVDMIPTSLTSLNIRLRKKPRAVPDIIQLGEAAAAGRFPNLKHVTVEAYFYVREYGNHGPLIAQPEIQALGPEFADAFRGSRATVEVREIPKRFSGGHPIPVL